MNSNKSLPTISSEHVYSIDLFRYYFAVLIVAGHCGLFINCRWLGFFLVRAAVPFFLCVSGYFYLKKLSEGKRGFWKYCSRLLQTYSIWSVPYYVLLFFDWGHDNIRSFLSYMAVSFLFAGSSYHFWFFPALLFSVALSTLFFHLKLQKFLIPCSLIFYGIGVLCCAYARITQQIPFISYLCASPYFSQIRHILFTGFPCFVSGYVVYLLRTKSVFFNNNSVLIQIISVAVWIVEAVAILHFKTYGSLALTFGMYPLVVCMVNTLLLHPMKAARTCAVQLRMIANLTYYSHVLLIAFVTWAAGLFGATQFANISRFFVFFITVMLAHLIGISIYKSKNRFLLFLVR